jgi:hypothetical protein
MAWHDDPTHPFAGIAEKLKRADENIVNLKTEIEGFFRDCKYPTIPQPNDKSWQDAIDYHRSLDVPLRFSVLNGEIVHHLRSCLDHLVWIFSSAKARAKPNNVAFPIIATVPPTKDELARIERNIEGISNTQVRDMIRDLQPFNDGANAGNHLLAVVHEMDRVDKHRELLLMVGGSANIVFPAGTPTEVVMLASSYTQGHPLTPSQLGMVGREIKKNHQVSPDIAFREFGKWKTQPVVPSLQQISNGIRAIMDAFSAEI